MDIANRIGVSSGSQNMVQGPTGLMFAVEIIGLTNNPTHGISAERDQVLTAQVTGLSQNAPPPTYQWTVNGAPVAGATSASYAPDNTIPALAAVGCTVTVGGHAETSPTATLRDAPPTLQNSLYDEVFDVDIGPQEVAAAAAFAGKNLSFSASGAGASVDAQTGVVSVPTDVEVVGAIVTVNATNSGGTASTAFQVTVEDISVEGALPFGALTPAGAGGVPVLGTTIVSGNAQGHWEIANGHLVPSAQGAGALAGVYSLEFDSGDVLDVVIEADKASARPEELALVFNALPVTARGLLVQDGDGRGAGRQRLEPKVFTSECLIEPANWIEDADPRQSVRPVILAGLTIGGDPSGDEILRMENLTVQGFVCQMVQGPGESEGNNGIILVERPSRHVVIRQNEVWSRDCAEVLAADDFRDNLATSGQMRGIATKVYPGINEHIRVEENWVHDVSRGIMMTATSAYQGVRSRLANNIIEDCYTNFFTCGYLDGLDILDNHCMHIWASLRDTLGAYPQTSPHASVGGGFDAGGSRTTQNITMMGNLLHIGWHRTRLHEEMGLDNIVTAATGVKFNDPGAADSYWNIVVAFNTIVSHNICLEVAGGSADEYLQIFNNTLASERYVSTTGGPVIFFVGAQNVRLWNNIATGYDISGEDGTGFFARTIDTLQSYGNIEINSGSIDFGEVDYFVGSPPRAAMPGLPERTVQGLAFLTIDEALTAYTPKPGTGAMQATQKKGAQGTSLYLGNGAHMVVWAPPQPSGPPIAQLPVTLWDGSAYMERTDPINGLQSGYNYKSFLFAWEGEPAQADEALSLFSYYSSYLHIQRLSSGGLQVYAQNVNTGAFLRARTGFQVNPGEMSRVAISYDMESGRIQFVRNGVFDPFPNVTLLARAEKMHVGSRPVRLHADHLGAQRFNGRFGRAYFHPTTGFVDLEEAANLSKLYAADGSFADWNPDGSAVAGEVPMLYIRRMLMGLDNAGGGGSFALNGSVADA